jgi:hypothetical protein
VAKKEPPIDYPGAPYKSGDKVTLVRDDGKPYAIRTVVSTAKREMLVTAHDPNLAPVRVKYNDREARATQPGDDEAIRLAILKRTIHDLTASSLDAEALEAVAPIISAWRGRDARRKRRLKAHLRVALMSGQPTPELRIKVERYGYISSVSLSSIMHEIGAANVPNSNGHVYQRAPTREDSIDACILSELGQTPNWLGMDPEQLLRMLQGTVSIQPSVTADEFREARYRCGVVPGERLSLQEFDGNRESRS